jgi:dynein heavy chain, axonemal
LRNYPSLINCCTIDWVDKWPEEALMGVAKMKLDDKTVSEACVFAHKEIESLASTFFMETRRKVFVTSKHYISLIETFNHLLNEQRIKL